MLALNFHKTFKPERRLIASLLEYAALGKQGSLQDIAVDTGIPMGKSTGKAPAMLDYAKGMGLIELGTNQPSSIKKPTLTSFGRIVYSEDKFMGQEIVQLLAHMNLSRRDIGARAWHVVFGKGRHGLGSFFSKQQVEEYLVSIFGPGNDRTGPLLVMYTDDAAFERSGVLSVLKDNVKREKAPLLDAYALSYSAYILSLMEAFFPGQNQVTITDFNEKTLWFDICLWSKTEIEKVLLILERRGFISIDRQMQPWILEKNAMADEVWPRIFDDMA